MKGEAWFTPKSYGYGATPKNWRGWLATALYLLSVLVLVGGMLGVARSDSERTALWIAILAVTAVFVALVRVKCDGEWRWRWGN